MIFTRNLLNLIENYKRTLPDKEFQSFNSYIGRLVSECIRELSQYAPGVERGRRLHKLIEVEIQNKDSSAVTCQKGCSACCHFEVEITSDDAAALAHTVQEGLQIDLEKLKRLSLRDKNDPLWRIRMTEENRCVFLGEDNACRVYDSRPSTCRKTSVTSEPSECSNPYGKTVAHFIPNIEILLSAALSFQETEQGALPKLVYKALQSDKDKEISIQVLEV